MLPENSTPENHRLHRETDSSFGMFRYLFNMFSTNYSGKDENAILFLNEAIQTLQKSLEEICISKRKPLSGGKIEETEKKERDLSQEEANTYLNFSVHKMYCEGLITYIKGDRSLGKGKLKVASKAFRYLDQEDNATVLEQQLLRIDSGILTIPVLVDDNYQIQINASDYIV